MRQILIGIICLCLVTISRGAPAPFNNIHKTQEVLPGNYMMRWGDSIPGKCILYPKGGYIQIYITQQIEYQWIAGLDMPVESKILSKQLILGKWKWDKKNRILILRERLADGSLVDRVFRFELKRTTLETEAGPTSFDKIHLSLKRVK